MLCSLGNPCPSAPLSPEGSQSRSQDGSVGGDGEGRDDRDHRVSSLFQGGASPPAPGVGGAWGSRVVPRAQSAGAGAREDGGGSDSDSDSGEGEQVSGRPLARAAALQVGPGPGVTAPPPLPPPPLPLDL